MPIRLNFTTDRLAKLTCPAGLDRLYVHDEKTLGLVLCVTATGAKSFYLYRRVLGKPTRVRMGLWPDEYTVDTARKEAAQLNSEIAKGNDPRQAKRQKRAEFTFGELFEVYLERHAKAHKRSWAEDDRQYKAYLTGWKSKRLSEIDRPTVQALHARLGKNNGRYVGNRVLSLVRAMFNKAVDLIGWNKPNPAAKIAKFKEESRERFLLSDELPRWFKALEEEPEHLQDFFLLCLYTGARRRNVEGMEWGALDLDKATWRIPGAKAKAGKELIIHLPKEALAILQRRQDARKESPWVFPSHSAAGHLVEPMASWRRLLARAGISGLRIHDLRRSLGSWQAASGASLTIIGKSLGHSSPQATAVYSRLELDPVRRSVDTAVSAMMAVVKASKERKVQHG